MLQQIRSRRKEIQNQLRQLGKDIKALQASVPKIELEIGNCETVRENLTTLIPQLEEQLAENQVDNAQLEELEAEVNLCMRRLDDCTEKASELEQRKATLQKAILGAGGNEFKKQESKCKKLQEELDKIEKDIRTAKVAIATNEKSMTKAEEASTKAEEQIAAAQETLEKHQADLKALEADAFAVMEAYEKVKALESEKKEELETSAKDFEEFKKSQSSAKCLEVDLLGQIDAIDKQMDDNRTKSSHWESEMMKLEDAAKRDEEEWGDLTDDDEECEGGDEGDDRSKMNEECEVEKDNVKKSNSKSILPIYSPEILNGHDRDTLKERIAILETERNTIAKNANLGAIAEYQKKETEFMTR